MQAVITSYNFLGQLRDNSKDLTFRVVIMDEAHYIKNKKVSLCRSGKPVRVASLTLISAIGGTHPCRKQDNDSGILQETLPCTACSDSSPYLHRNTSYTMDSGKE